MDRKHKNVLENVKNLEAKREVKQSLKYFGNWRKKLHALNIGLFTGGCCLQRMMIGGLTVHGTKDCQKLLEI